MEDRVLSFTTFHNPTHPIFTSGWSEESLLSVFPMGTASSQEYQESNPLDFVSASLCNWTIYAKYLVLIDMTNLVRPAVCVPELHVGFLADAVQVFVKSVQQAYRKVILLHHTEREVKPS